MKKFSVILICVLLCSLLFVIPTFAIDNQSYDSSTISNSGTCWKLKDTFDVSRVTSEIPCSVVIYENGRTNLYTSLRSLSNGGIVLYDGNSPRILYAENGSLAYDGYISIPVGENVPNILVSMIECPFYIKGHFRFVGSSIDDLLFLNGKTSDASSGGIFNSNQFYYNDVLYNRLDSVNDTYFFRNTDTGAYTTIYSNGSFTDEIKLYFPSNSLCFNTYIASNLQSVDRLLEYDLSAYADNNPSKWWFVTDTNNFDFPYAEIDGSYLFVNGDNVPNDTTVISNTLLYSYNFIGSTDPFSPLYPNSSNNYKLLHLTNDSSYGFIKQHLTAIPYANDGNFSLDSTYVYFGDGGTFDNFYIETYFTLNDGSTDYLCTDLVYFNNHLYALTEDNFIEVHNNYTLTFRNATGNSTISTFFNKYLYRYGDPSLDNFFSNLMSMPENALSNLTLFVTSNGVPITLWNIFQTFVAISIIVWILKLFMGG